MWQSTIWLLVAGLLVLFAPAPPILATALDVRAAPGVSNDAVGEIQQVLRDADQFFASEFGAAPSVSVRIYLFGTAESYVAGLLRDGVGVNPSIARMALQPDGHWMMTDSGGQIFINLGNPRTQNRPAFLSDLSHELVHVYHFELSGRRGAPHAWVMEGTAEVFAKRFLDHKGLLAYPHTIAEAFGFSPDEFAQRFQAYVRDSP